VCPPTLSVGISREWSTEGATQNRFERFNNRAFGLAGHHCFACGPCHVLPAAPATKKLAHRGHQLYDFDSEIRFRNALLPAREAMTALIKTLGLEAGITGRVDSRDLRGRQLEAKDLYSGLIRMHILHHAVEGPIFGLGIIEELGRHGYRVSAGTLYPILHSMEQKGYLSSSGVRQGRHFRRVYRATPKGRSVLRQAMGKVRELFGELFKKED
jgi:PadR family transcriptional regulator, regulatory protein PadR